MRRVDVRTPLSIVLNIVTFLVEIVKKIVLLE